MQLCQPLQLLHGEGGRLRRRGGLHGEGGGCTGVGGGGGAPWRGGGASGWQAWRGMQATIPAWQWYDDTGMGHHSHPLLLVVPRVVAPAVVLLRLLRLQRLGAAAVGRLSTDPFINTSSAACCHCQAVKASPAQWCEQCRPAH